MPAIVSTRVLRSTVLTISVALIALCCLLPMSVAQAGSPSRIDPGEMSSLAGNAIEGQPICFTENRGQIVDTEGNPRPDILYSANVNGVMLYVRSTGISYVFSKPKQQENRVENREDARMLPEREASTVLYRMDMDFVGGNPFACVRPGRVLDGVSHYYLAHCPDGIRNVRTFEGVVLEDIYPSIDMRIKSVNGRLKSEFIVHPGGAPADIRMEYTGATALFGMPDGAMQVHGPLGFVEESRPVSWQEDGLPVGTSFRIDKDVVRWEVGEYDRQQTLILDPWAALHGGSDYDTFYTLDTDAAGNIYAGGCSLSSDFPVQSAVQATVADDYDVVIVKYSSSAQLIWSTYYGGSDAEFAHELRIDPSGNVIIAGFTWGSDFPVKNAWQPTFGGVRDAFLMKFSSSGTPAWATFYGGSQEEYNLHQSGLNVGSAGEVYFCAMTESADLPVARGIQMTHGGGKDMFISKFHPSGGLNWATFLGSSGDDVATACEITAAGTIAIGGVSNGPFPLLNPIHASLQGNRDAVVAEFDTAGTMLWSTYLTGGADVDWENGIDLACAGNGDLYVLMMTSSANLPTVNPVQGVNAGGEDLYLCRLVQNAAPAHSRSMDWATYYGGSGNDDAYNLSIAQQGNIVFAGQTSSTDYPLVNPLQGALKGSSDLCITEFDASHTPVFSSYLGGSSAESLEGVRYTAAGDIVLCGRTKSTDFPLLATSQQVTPGASYDGLLCHLGAGGPVILPPDPPTNLTTIALSPTRVQLDWQDNADNENSFIIEHHIAGTQWAVVGTAPTNTETWVLVNASPGTEHSFRVKAVNAQGESDWSNTATATTGPFDAPVNLTAMAHSSESVVLHWEDQTDGEEGFYLEYRESGMNWIDGGEAAQDAEIGTVDGLDENTAYEFRIRAFAGSIVSAYSNTAQATTLLYLATPTNLDGILVSETQVSLSWEDKADGETGLEIEHNVDNQGWTLLHTTAENVESYDVQGLTPNTTSAFRVRAVGPNAASGYSNVYSVLTRMKPATPENLLAVAVDHTSIRITWERGSENEDGYEVDRRAPGGNWEILTTTGPDDGDILDEDLSPSTTYWYRVRATNDLGYSEWSEEDSATTKNIPAPDVPFGLRAMATGPTSVNLTWVMRSPCTAESFEIEESLTGESSSFSSVTVDVDGSRRAYEVTELDPDTEYFLRIRAVNNSGTSPYSSIVNARTARGDYPSTPRAFTATALSDTQIELRWEMPSQSNEDGFTLERSLTGNAGDFAELHPAPAKGTKSYSDSGLSVNTTYHYRILAYNAKGSSPWTAVVHATTQSQPISYRDRLYYTCKAWGLLKYHHSEVSTCKLDWDAALLSTLPAVKAADDVDEFNDVLLKMYQTAGSMAEAVGTLPQVPDELRINRDFDWLEDAALRPEVRDSLLVVLEKFRPHDICCARVQNSRSYLEFPGDDPNLDAEVFKDYPDEGHRLLGMFTYWNILAWFNPNAKILDAPWDSTLHRNILDVAEAENADEFYDAYRHMASALNDAHVNGYISRPGESFSVYGPKIVLGWHDDNYTIVKSDIPEIAVGDILLEMDGKTVEQLEADRSDVTSYGNPAVFHRDFCYEVLKGTYYDPITLTLQNPTSGEYTYSGKRNYAMNSSWHYSYYPCDSLGEVTWKVLDGGVGYVNMGNLVVSDVAAMYDELRALPAIIFDVRNYPRGTIWDIADAIFPAARTCTKLLLPDMTYPGTYSELPLQFGLNGNSNAYKGKVIILCNAETQSQAEWTCMILRGMPNAVIVGSQTAGADGNVSGWYLTKDITAGFTSLGVYWPDGRQTQRIGIVPDSFVVATREDIIAGRDPVLIKALQIAGVTVKAESLPIAGDIRLEQNYPNPFHGQCCMQFTMPRTGHVRITLHDMLGREVRLLSDGRWNRGTHTITIDAAGLPAGSYICRMQVGRYIISRIVTLLRR